MVLKNFLKKLLKRKEKVVKIDIEINKLIPCLIRNRDKKVIKTRVEKIDVSSLNKNEWMFDWEKLDKNVEVLGLYVEEDDRLQGLIAYEEKKEDLAYMVHLIENSYFNYKNNPKNTKKIKEYSGIMQVLFFEILKQSMKKGYDGYVYFISKTYLVDYYHKTLGAVYIGNNKMYIFKNNIQIITKNFKK